MGTIRRDRDDAITRLPARCVIGKAAGATLRIDDPYASQQHAKLTWTGEGWMLRDLGSRNGTFIDGDRVAPDTPRLVPEGAAIGFGDKRGWTLVDAGGPVTMAVRLADGHRVDAQGDLLALPDDSATVTIYPDPHGGWVAQWQDGRVKAVKDTETITVEGEAFGLHLPGVVDRTPLAETVRTLDTVVLSFGDDPEQVELVVRGVAEALPKLAYWRVVRALAVAREVDAASGAETDGWRDLETLAEQLGIATRGVYTSIHRARRAVASAGVQGAAGLVEVANGRRRFGARRFEITGHSSDRA